jgi:hypothetical protein
MSLRLCRGRADGVSRVHGSPDELLRRNRLVARYGNGNRKAFGRSRVWWGISLVVVLSLGLVSWSCLLVLWSCGLVVVWFSGLGLVMCLVIVLSCRCLVIVLSCLVIVLSCLVCVFVSVFVYVFVLSCLVLFVLSCFCLCLCLCTYEDTHTHVTCYTMQSHTLFCFCVAYVWCGRKVLGLDPLWTKHFGRVTSPGAWKRLRRG